MDTTEGRRTHWQLIAPGAVLLLLGLRMGDPTPTGVLIALVVIGGGLLLTGLIRSFGMRDSGT